VYFEMRSVVYIYSVFYVELVFQYTMDVFFSAHPLVGFGVSSALPLLLPDIGGIMWA
jgi:hypothetical protein